jgi:hypothetical protein
MRWSLAGLLAVAVATVILVPALRLPGLVGLGVLVTVAAFKIGYCHHPGPLGLMPPVTNPDGTRTQAQWYCDQCGRSWPTALGGELKLVRRFDGFDQTKAADAARRAEELTKRQRHLALRRAGLEPQRRPRLRPDAAEVVPIANVRQFVK